jgi:ankyrin repeat protein
VANSTIEVIETLVRASTSDLTTGDLIYCAVLRYGEDKDENTALEIIRMLVRAGTPVDKIVWDNEPAYREKAHLLRGTALHEACRQGWERGVKLLLENGADPDKLKQWYRGDEGRTPREIAEEKGEGAILKIMQDYGKSAGRD